MLAGNGAHQRILNQVVRAVAAAGQTARKRTELGNELDDIGAEFLASGRGRRSFGGRSGLIGRHSSSGLRDPFALTSPVLSLGAWTNFIMSSGNGSSRTDW